MQEKESIIRHRIEIGIFNPRDDRAVCYLGGASVPPGPVIPRVENADLKSMPINDSHSNINKPELPYRHIKLNFPFASDKKCNYFRFFYKQ